MEANRKMLNVILDSCSLLRDPADIYDQCERGLQG